MLNMRMPAMRSQTLISLIVFGLGIWLAYQIGEKIAGGDLGSLEFWALGLAACAGAIVILRNWRRGFYLFLFWLLFEDLVRKYLGNGLALFFGKDILCGLMYISLLVAIRNGRERGFRPPFLMFLGLFVWLGAVQIFNQNSPNVVYGLLGFKLYFYYVPLMFVGYALIRSDRELANFLSANAGLAGVIAALGIAQAILGHSFLNPTYLAPELRDLGELDKVTPISNQVLSLPSSVFVSSGRFGAYLVLAVIVCLGTAGYLFLNTRRYRILVLFAIASVVTATLFSGTRGALMCVLASAVALPAAFLWGAPWRWRQTHRMLKAIRRSVIFGGLALAAFVMIFPQAVAPRIAFYLETLLPSSSAYELQHRTWQYPIENLLKAFTNPNWVLGNGIGTASLGMQYVAKLTGTPPPQIWVEQGWGQLILEMGILAPFLWLLWTGALIYYGWQVVRRLRETRFFPIGFAILWYAFLLLYPITFGGIYMYQNYVGNAYLWLLVGILFRLPQLQAADLVLPAGSPGQIASRGGLSFAEVGRRPSPGFSGSSDSNPPMSPRVTPATQSD